MFRARVATCYIPTCMLIAFTAGCIGGPASVGPVSIDAAAAGSAAIEAYDQDGDGKLSAGELAAVPGIAKYANLYDKDSDGSVSGEEITARLQKWQDGGLGFRELVVKIMLDGKPLGGAQVEFIPEAYLGDDVKPAQGETDPDGTGLVGVAKEDMPAALAGKPIFGIKGGTYKVKITHPTKKLPAKFNTETTIGEEVADDTVKAAAFFNLSTK